MFEDLITDPVELERMQLLFLNRAVTSMREVGMSDDQIDEALGRQTSGEAGFSPGP